MACAWVCSNKVEHPSSALWEGDCAQEQFLCCSWYYREVSEAKPTSTSCAPPSGLRAQTSPQSSRLMLVGLKTDTCPAKHASAGEDLALTLLVLGGTSDGSQLGNSHLHGMNSSPPPNKMALE